jgi:hypothetical protein
MTEEDPTLEHKLQIWERRKEIISLHFHRGLTCETMRNIAEKYGCSYQNVCIDWKRRNHWMHFIVHYDDQEKFTRDLVFEFKAALDECWHIVEMAKAKGTLGPANAAIRNMTEILGKETELLQSMGRLPKEPTVLEQKIEQVPVNVSNSDAEILSQAARILNKAESSPNEPAGLH